MKDKCKNCAHPSKACISYLMTLSTKEMLVWCRMWKDRLGWSNAALAEKTNVPSGTIGRVLGHSKLEDEAAGVKLDTIRPIICAITGCTLEELEACEGLHDLEVATLVERNKELKEDVERLKKEAVNQRTFLAEQIKIKDRYIAILGAFLAICVILIIAALVVDALNPDKGFFWLDGAYWENSTDILNRIKKGWL